MRKRNLHTILITVLGLGGLTYVLFALSLTFRPDITNYFNRTEFNSESWKNWQESESELALRLNMVHDLQHKYKLEGMTVRQIVELLGEPDRKSRNELSYYLGHSGHGINTAHLILKIENRKVTAYDLWEG